MEYLESSEHSKRLQRAENPALVLSIAPLCFIFNRTSKKLSPMVLSCCKSRTASPDVGEPKSAKVLLGRGILRTMVPRRRLTWKGKKFFFLFFLFLNSFILRIEEKQQEARKNLPLSWPASNPPSRSDPMT